MRNIKTETAGCMTGFDREGEVLTAQFLFPETFSGFQGHFPDRKVLPGVCQILCALAVVERGEGVPVSLTEVILAKYAAPVFPDESLTCIVQRTTGESAAAVYKARLEVHGKKVAELKLRVEAR